MRHSLINLALFAYVVGVIGCCEGAKAALRGAPVIGVLVVLVCCSLFFFCIYFAREAAMTPREDDDGR